MINISGLLVRSETIAFEREQRCKLKYNIIIIISLHLQVTLNLTSLEMRAEVVTLFQVRQVNTWVRWLWSALTVRMEVVCPVLCLKFVL